MNPDEDRASVAADRAKFERLPPAAAALLETANGFRQFDRLESMIDEGVRNGSFRLRPYQLQDLNRLAVDGLIEFPGSFRAGPIYISKSQHTPPDAESVPRLVDEMCDYVNANWSSHTPIHLASYVMWRLNWIHPFGDGNGRTSRAASYLVLCVNLRVRLPGARTIPERIVGDKTPYYNALDAADAAWRHGDVDVSTMEELMRDYLAAQLVSVYTKAWQPPSGP
jgi:Fic family protein